MDDSIEAFSVPSTKDSKNNMKFFCMPSDFKTETLDEYNERNQKYENSKIIETYGQITVDNPFGSCRNPIDLPQVDGKLLEAYVKHGLDMGIQFNYVINATCMANDELTNSGFRKTRDFFTMLQDIGVSWVTISLPSLMEIVQYAAPGLKIKASTVSLINSPSKAKFYDELGITRIVLDEDIYRRFDILKNIRKAYSGDLEIIVNSFCVNDCPYKTFHYNSFSHSNAASNTAMKKYPYYNTRCNLSHIGAENYMKLNWVRPEDIHYYTDIGINFFKIQGRTNVYTGNPAKAVSHYMEQYYDGDLLSLLELFSDTKPLTIAGTSIDNRKLDGFFDKFVKSPTSCTKVCSECGYCRSFAEASISALDISLLEIMDMLKGVKAGEFPKALE